MIDFNSPDYSPHDLLPIKDPRTHKESREFFYKNVVKHLIPDVLRITSNGTPLDMEKVFSLEEELDSILEATKTKLTNNPLIQKYLKRKRKTILQEECKRIRSILKHVSEEPKELFNFSYSNIQHRTYVVNYYLSCNPRYAEYQLDSWKIKDLHKLNMLISSNFITKLINHTLDMDNEYIVNGMKKYVNDKVYDFNVRKVQSLKRFSKLEEFNPNSSTQKAELFSMLGIDIDEKTETGQMKTSREEIEKLLYEYKDLLSEDEDNKYYQDLIQILESFISQSNSAIIKNTFIKSFYLYSLNSTLYSSLHLFGTKTFRCTSSDPNMLNMPSSGNIFTKPFKKCLSVPKGWIVYTADFAALEDRVVANLSKDKNKCAVFTDGIDGHCLNSYSYFKEGILKELPKLDGESDLDYVKRYKEEVDKGNKVLKKYRQDSKRVTFGLNYGAGPKKVAKQLNISLEEAEKIYDRYHNELYKDITNMRKEVYDTAKQNGELHIGLGCYIKSSDPDAEIRTLFNSMSQFWSILTLLTINKLHKEIDKAGYTEDIKVINTIYDSIYLIVKEDPKIIKWLNDTILPIMAKDFIEGQIVHNEAAAEIGYNWYDLHQIKDNATIEEIQSIIDEAKNGC